MKTVLKFGNIIITAFAVCIIFASLLFGYINFSIVIVLGYVIVHAVMEQKQFDHRQQATDVAQEKISSEIDILSQEILRLQKSIFAIQQKLQASESLSDTEALTREVGLLSGVVRELAGVIAAQELEVKKLQEKVAQQRDDLAEEVQKMNESFYNAKIVTEVNSAAPKKQPDFPERITFGQNIPGDSKKAAILKSFDNDGVEVWLQPIVNLPQRKVVAYEAVPRLRCGETLLGRDEFVGTLSKNDRAGALDRAMVARAGGIADHLASRGSGAAVGYSLAAPISDRASLVGVKDLVSKKSSIIGRVQLALAQENWRRLDAGQKALLKEIGERVGLVLNWTTDLRFDGRGPSACGFELIRVPARMMSRLGDEEISSDIVVANLVPMLKRVGIQFVATEVEAERDIPELIDLDIPLAQGSVFAAARAVRPELLKNKAVESVEPTEASETKSDPVPRRSFRDFLRRAG